MTRRSRIAKNWSLLTKKCIKCVKSWRVIVRTPAEVPISPLPAVRTVSRGTRDWWRRSDVKPCRIASLRHSSTSNQKTLSLTILPRRIVCKHNRYADGLVSPWLAWVGSDFWATVTSNGSPYATGPLSWLSVCPVCLWRWCIVAKRLDGSRCHLVRR